MPGRDAGAALPFLDLPLPFLDLPLPFLAVSLFFDCLQVGRHDACQVGHPGPAEDCGLNGARRLADGGGLPFAAFPLRLSTAFSLPSTALFTTFPLDFHCLSLTLHCLFTACPGPSTASAGRQPRPRPDRTTVLILDHPEVHPLRRGLDPSSQAGRGQGVHAVRERRINLHCLSLCFHCRSAPTTARRSQQDAADLRQPEDPRRSAGDCPDLPQPGLPVHELPGAAGRRHRAVLAAAAPGR